MSFSSLAIAHISFARHNSVHVPAAAEGETLQHIGLSCIDGTDV